MINKANKKNGFTLLELLVVISITSLLSSILLTSLTNVKTKAQDAQRSLQISQIQTALTLYNAQNGGFPSSIGCGSTVIGPNWCNSVETSTWNILQTSLSPYIATLPVDPKPIPGNWGSGGGSYSYFSDNSGWYMLVYKLETKTMLSPGSIDCSGSLWNYGGSNVLTSIITTGGNCK